MHAECNKLSTKWYWVNAASVQCQWSIEIVFELNIRKKQESMNLTYSLTSYEIYWNSSSLSLNIWENISKLRNACVCMFSFIIIIDNYMYDKSDDDRSKCDFADSPMKLSSNNTHTHTLDTVKSAFIEKRSIWTKSMMASSRREHVNIFNHLFWFVSSFFSQVCLQYTHIHTREGY